MAPALPRVWGRAQKSIFLNKLLHECYDQTILVTTELQSSPRCCRILLDEYVSFIFKDEFSFETGFCIFFYRKVKLQFFWLLFLKIWIIFQWGRQNRILPASSFFSPKKTAPMLWIQVYLNTMTLWLIYVMKSPF